MDEHRADLDLRALHPPREGHSLVFGRLLSQLTSLLFRGPVGREIARRLDQNRAVTRPRIRLRRGHEGLHGLRIAFVSDVHAGSFMDERDLLHFFGRVAAEQPHLVCLGGDLIDCFESQSLLLRKGLALLDPPLGVYAVPGNHEYNSDPRLRTWLPVLQELGIRVLLNRGERIHHRGASVWLAGVDDLTEGDPDLQRALDGRDPQEPVIVLSHHPDFFAEACRHDVDLMLSGHTHGGQILPFGRAFTSHTRLGYWSGRYSALDAQLYVSRGVGVGFLPVRIGAPAEIPVIELVLGS